MSGLELALVLVIVMVAFLAGALATALLQLQRTLAGLEATRRQEAARR